MGKQTSSDTKNLVHQYQKLFNKARKFQKHPEVKSQQIRQCTSVKCFKKLIMKHPKLQQTMLEMFDSGVFIKAITKWKSVHNSMIVLLKYLRRLHLIVQNPNVQGLSWIEGDQNLIIDSNIQPNQNEQISFHIQIPNSIRSIQALKQGQSGLQQFLNNEKQQTAQVENQQKQQFVVSTMVTIVASQTQTHSIKINEIVNPYVKNSLIALEVALQNCLNH